VSDEVEKEDNLGGEHSCGVWCFSFSLVVGFPLCFLFFVFYHSILPTGFITYYTHTNSFLTSFVMNTNILVDKRTTHHRSFKNKRKPIIFCRTLNLQFIAGYDVDV
jgi:hypothetical protein